MSDDAVRAAAEEVYEYPNVHSMRPSVSEIEAIISRHVQTDKNERAEWSGKLTSCDNVVREKCRIKGCLCDCHKEQSR